MAADLVIESLCKSYGDIQALKGVSLSVDSGQIVALLGNNGAGKSTLMSIAGGLLAAESGYVEVLGKVVRAGGGSSPDLGLAPQEEALYPTLSVAQNLTYFGRLAGVRGAELEARVRRTARDLMLTEYLERKAGQLSGGQRRRLHVALALMHNPTVLLLDEPTIGVDIDARRELLDFVRQKADSGVAILYSTHQLHEVEQLGAHVVIVDHGEVLASGAVSRLVAEHARPAAILEFDAGAPLPDSWVAQCDEVVVRGSGKVEVTVCLDEADVPIADVIEQLPDPVSELLRGARVTAPSLEQAYLEITRSSGLRYESQGSILPPEARARSRR